MRNRCIPGIHEGTAKSLKEQLDALERHLIEGTLEACGGNQSLTARVLRVSRAKLLYKLAEYRLGASKEST